MNNYAQASGTTLRIERRLPGPIERVWAYIVEPEKRALWWVGGAWDLRVGGKTQCEWDHTRLSHEPTPEAWKSFDGMTTEGTISRLEPPRLLAYKGDMGMGEFEVTFELEPDGDDVIFSITQAPVDGAQAKAGFASGWHAYVDILEDRVRNAKPRAFWTNFDRLEKEYAGRFKD
jgi:uncharacterized protein YndB with AHSA1/START domain